MDTLLGLDLGTHSIGWTLIETDADEMPTRIIATGARIFNQVLDDKTQSPKNEERRMARLRRRQTARRAYRREKLKRLLGRHGLLPAELLDPRADGAKLCNALGDPYALRVKALTQPLAPHELGRVLLHLVQRRGFKSNRKTDRGNKETGIVKEGIAGLRAALAQSGAPTLGSHLATLPEKRRIHTARGMFEQEYDAILAVQAAQFPEVLTPDCKVEKRIWDLLYDQRELKKGTSTLGDCQFEQHRPRACKARLEAQEFISLQVLANLRIFRRDALDFALPTPAERAAIRAKLADSAKLTWKALRNLLNISTDERINLEEGGSLEHLPGNGTAAALAKALGKKEWAALDEAHRLSLVEDLLTIGDDTALQRRLREHWQFDEATADALFAAKLPGEDDYLRVSLKAVRRILPLLEAGLAKPEGCTYSEAVHQIYGANRGGVNRPAVRELPEPDDLRNPAVRKVLFELRKVIHAIIRAHGVPGKIHLEMARDLKHSKKQRAEIQAGITKNKNENDAARRHITAEFHIGNPNDTEVLRFRLWKELCDESGVAFCPYTGRPIPAAILFSDQIDIEHILPLSRSMDDSKANKTLCFADYNRQHKRNRTPWEACGRDPAAHAEMLGRVRKLKAKYRRFMLGRDAAPGEIEKLLQQHQTRTLQDTRHIAVAAKEYLAPLGADIEVSSGPLTAALRRQWGLDSLLNPDGRGKNREDHRHHAVDAAVIACTTRGMVQRAARAAASEQFLAADDEGRGFFSNRFDVPPPWPDFRRDLGEKIAALLVSHAPTRALTGALHKETAYGAHPDRESGTTRYHVRQKVEDLAKAFKKAKNPMTILEEIVDAEVRRRVTEFFNVGDAEARIARNEYPLHADGRTPIKRVRIARTFSAASLVAITAPDGSVRHYESGSNHHVEVFENLDNGKWTGRFVTAFAAAQRARAKTPLVDRTPPPGHRFVMSLCINDCLEVDTDGERRVFRVQMMTPEGAGKLTLRAHQAIIKRETDATVLRKTPNTLRELNPRKLDVTPLGEIRRAGG
jgi:CRISPR-associated endonuclease Csn1